jgi:pimeloyl-ACP methyl ester carboxylesterase
MLSKLMLFDLHPQQFEQAILDLTSQKKDPSVLQRWVALRLANPVSGFNALRQLMAAAQFRACIDQPSVPTILLASEQDQLVSVACSRSMARQWQCALQVHPNAGHDLPLDDGLWVARQVLEWVTKLP